MIRSVEELLRILTTGLDRKLFIFNLESLDIFKQLRFEEFIYRNVTPKCTNTAFLILNHFYNSSTVVFGLSGEVSDFIKDLNYCKLGGIKLIRRFTGGGTVLIDDNIITSSIIATHSFAPNLNPNNISHWAFKFYQSTNLFTNHFHTVDGDFSYHNLLNTNSTVNSGNSGDTNVDTENPVEWCKVGGNAQAYGKYSFVHHTSFIWRVSPEIEKILLVPKKAPKYRNNRGHTQFLQSVTKVLKVSDKHQFIQLLIQSLSSLYSTTLILYRGLDSVNVKSNVRHLDEEVINNCINNFKSHTNYIHFYSYPFLHTIYRLV
eukprot:XP_763109.1 hypothetical protein [Theileria parva strain Muguga]